MSQLDKLQNSSLDYNYSDSLCPAVKGVMYECGFEDLAHRRKHHLLCMVNHMILIILTKEDQKLHSQVGTKSSSEQYP